MLIPSFDSQFDNHALFRSGCPGSFAPNTAPQALQGEAIVAHLDSLTIDPPTAARYAPCVAIGLVNTGR